MKISPLFFGAAYYPEHWPEERWPEDIRLMKDAGLNVVRMAEFAWSTLEPSAGVFNFDWLERVIELLASAGIKSVLGTPTAAPPAWLIQAHPDILAIDETGRRVQFGNRCHYCVNSSVYHQAVRRIVTAMALKFGQNPHVIGWQLDNEYNRICYCDDCHAQFQKYLAEKYGSLDNLNKCWSTAYWSQTYSSWEQIPIPIGPHNPGLRLEFKNFNTYSYAQFQKLQLDTLRPHLKPNDFVTHNFMGWYDGFDHYTMAADLDLASWDSYIGSGHHSYLKLGLVHDLTRGFKRQNFWVMETQPVSVNWAQVNNPLNKGEARVMAWQAVAHGADAVLYWQWRSALGGQEQYHGTVVDSSGQPRPFYSEVQTLGKEFAKASEFISGSQVNAPVAILNDYESRWSIDYQRHHKDFDYVNYLEHFALPIAAQGIPLDIISADQPLDGYKLVIAPALLIFDEPRVEKLKEFVQKGGHLVLTARCGMKDRSNALLAQRQPGALAELAGVEVEDFYAIDEEIPVRGSFFAGKAKIWAERLRVLDTKSTCILANYGAGNGWLDDQPAATARNTGSSIVYYIGTWLDEPSQRVLIDQILKNANLNGIPTPPGVELCTRFQTDGREIVFVINHERKTQTLHLPWRSHDLLSECELENEFTLSPYGVYVLTHS